MSARRSQNNWKSNGPRMLGYQPGWLWWVLMSLLVIAGIGLIVLRTDREQSVQHELDTRIETYARQAGLPSELVHAVVAVESGGDPKAVSYANARGLMQITPITLADVQSRFDVPAGGVEDLYDPDYNLHIGTVYLAYLLERFEGDTKLALAAYHMGPTAIARLRREHPALSTDELLKLDGENQVGSKTRAYVKKVMGLVGDASP